LGLGIGTIKDSYSSLGPFPLEVFWKTHFRKGLVGFGSGDLRVLNSNWGGDPLNKRGIDGGLLFKNFF